MKNDKAVKKEHSKKVNKTLMRSPTMNHRNFLPARPRPMRLVKLVLTLGIMAGSALTSIKSEAGDWTLVIHGGAGVLEHAQMTAERDRYIRAALTRALEAGGAIMEHGGSALDAVEAAVLVLEDDPFFNAGKGAVFTAQGTNELDAAIMDGKNRTAGAVAAVTRTKNPIRLARAVLDKGVHVMLVGPGADAFSKEYALEQVEPEYFRTEERWQQFQEMKNHDKDRKPFSIKEKFGTVGAVARDSMGHLAAATSTGGLAGKRFGRVGDSPIIGAGTYADDRACAVSATGSGEFYIREGAAHEICARIRHLGETAQQAADAAQAETKALGGEGGVIVVGRDGSPAWSFNTLGMYRGRLSAGGKPFVAIYNDE